MGSTLFAASVETDLNVLSYLFLGGLVLLGISGMCREAGGMFSDRREHRRLHAIHDRLAAKGLSTGGVCGRCGRAPVPSQASVDQPIR